MPTLKQLQSRLERTEEALKRERDKNTRVFANVGWGAGMRRVNVGPSCRREDELKNRAEELREQIRRMSAQNAHTVNM